VAFFYGWPVILILSITKGLGMKRRQFVQMSVAAGVAAGMIKDAGAAVAGNILEAGVRVQSARMQAGTLTAQSLARQYLARIAKLDKGGPHINAIIELNPDALAIAVEMDRERKAGKVRGPLHGIPILLKDNIATADKMATSAGSLALAGVRARQDAHIVKQLRAAGAVILGKTNLSEWANMRSTHSTSGWSGRGGQTRNPHALDRNTSGSSSGSGAAMAASFATLAVGTETDGSIVSPASTCGIVGFKPTLGLLSRSGIIPIAASQDTAGPMTRSVEDAALMLAAMLGADPDDEATAGSAGKVPDVTQALQRDALRGKRLGVARNFFGSNDALDAIAEQALAVLKAQGAILVDVTIPNTDKYGDTETEVLLYEFKPGLENYLKTYAPDAPIRNMDELIFFNSKQAAREMPYFGQEHLIASAKKGGLDTPEYRKAQTDNRRFAREEGIDKVLRAFKLDALVAPTGGPAWLTDYINGDHYGGSFSSPAAVAGYPHVTVPAGFIKGLPVGLSFVGTAWSDAQMLGLAYAYEQASNARRAPAFVATVNPRL
jgi:amidase